MLSTLFNPHIINYEPTRGYIVPKFMTYDRTSDLFDHIMDYMQLMTIDMRNDAPLCNIFPANPHEQTFSRFHYLLKNSVNNF